MATKKDAYYFSHDANAQDDPKCMILIDQLGMEGYGIFWALIEKLRAEKDYKLPFNIIPSLARRWGTSKEKVETVVKIYDLFVIESDDFFSARLVRSMNEKSEKARISAESRWQQQRDNQPVNANGCERIKTHMRNDAIKVKESKVKESILLADKPQKIEKFIKPNKGQIVNYLSAEHKIDEFTAMGITDSFYDHYESNGWKIGGKSAMKDWKAAVRTWLRNRDKFSINQTSPARNINKNSFI